MVVVVMRNEQTDGQWIVVMCKGVQQNGDARQNAALFVHCLVMSIASSADGARGAQGRKAASRYDRDTKLRL